MAEPKKRTIVTLPENQSDFLDRIVHEDAATSRADAIRWCVDACMRIEEKYKIDACYIAWHDIRLPENDPNPPPSPLPLLVEGREKEDALLIKTLRRIEEILRGQRDTLAIALKEIQDWQMDKVELARSTPVYMIAEKALKCIIQVEIDADSRLSPLSAPQLPVSDTGDKLEPDWEQMSDREKSAYVGIGPGNTFEAGSKPEPSPEALEAAARSKHSLSEILKEPEAGDRLEAWRERWRGKKEVGENQEVPDSGGPQMCMVHHALAFSAWTCENLWSRHNGNWYPYQDDDKTISGDELWKLWQNSANVQSDAWWVSLEAVKAKTKALRAEISSLNAELNEVRDCYQCSTLNYRAELSTLKHQMQTEIILKESYNKKAAEVLDERDELQAEISSLKEELDAADSQNKLRPCACDSSFNGCPECTGPDCDRYTREKLFEDVDAKDAEIASLKEQLARKDEEIEASDILLDERREQLADRDAQIELLRKNGASLRPGISILDILKWAAKYKLRKYGAFFQRDYSSIGYTDETIVEDFLKDEANRNPNHKAK